MVTSLDKRVVLLLLLLAFVTVEFWAGSRYPALSEKLLMGTDTPVSGLAFSTVITIAADEDLVRRIVYQTVNWTYTNRQGMTFGILFGTLLMTLLRLISPRGVKSRFGNTVLGVLLGVPLGVCVNCAAPIGKAIHSAGARTETMLATMLTSPTLNVIVLTMLFTLLPVYLAVIKIGFTVAFLLIGIPLLTRFWGEPAVVTSSLLVPDVRPLPIPGGPTPPATQSDRDSRSATWLPAAKWVAQAVARDLWFVVRTTVPLMLLAGILGSVLISLMPLEYLADVLPSVGRKSILLAMAGVAMLGIFLPVPMSFDVIVTAILWHAGLPVQYVGVLLFTLGSFSFFPFFIVWKTSGVGLATSLLIGLAGTGLLAGAVGDQYFKWDFARQQRLIFDLLARNPASLHGPHVLQFGGESRVEMNGDQLVSSLQHAALVPQKWLAEAHGIAVERFPFRAPHQAANPGNPPPKLFTRIEGSALGLDEPYSYSVLQFIGPFTQFRGIASGDVHNDGWMDILLTAESGISLYANRGSGQFVLQNIDIPKLKTFKVVNAALVDLDNDGWLDIFFSTYRHGSYVIYNNRGNFNADNLKRLPTYQDVMISGAAAFGDINKDGYVDIVLGNWMGPCRSFSYCDDRASNNYLLQNSKSGGFELRKPFAGVSGRQTLSLLLSDINNDGNLDLVIGNEDPAPDAYFLGTGDGRFHKIGRNDGIIPHSAATTMSIASGDINNDLLPEIYIGQISGSTHRDAVRVRATGPENCDEFTQRSSRKNCVAIVKAQLNMPSQIRSRDAFKCLAPEIGVFREDCIALSLLLWGGETGREDLCDLFPSQWEVLKFDCKRVHREKTLSSIRIQPPDDREVPAIGQKNILLSPAANGRFSDIAAAMDVQVAGFTWNAKFADLNNDEYLDLFVVNGWFPERTRTSNTFFMNEHGRRFADRTAEVGLVSFLPTGAYTYVDLDNDGDLDIVTVPIASPVVVYLNNSEKNRIAFELRDSIGNYSGIGSKIIVHYGPGGTRHQLREIHAGSGFVSYDAPVAYFGLGDFENIERVEIRWSTGETSDIHANFPAGARYVLHR